MAKFARGFGSCIAALIATVGIASLSFGGQGSHAFGVHSGPGLPYNYSTHVPTVGNQRWGTGGRGNGVVNRPVGNSGWYNGRRYRYPGILAFPFFPVSDWGGYLGDSNPYYDQPAPPAEGYGPNDASAPPPPYYPPGQPYYSAQPQDPYPAAQEQQPAAAEAPAPPPITLVMHDGQKVQLSNYAVINDVVWDFSKPAARKIAISSIDLPASTKATEDSGAEFPDFNARPAPTP